MCNCLVTFGIYEFLPKNSVLLCTASARFKLVGFYNKYKCLKTQSSRKTCLDSSSSLLHNALLRPGTTNEHDLSSVILPICVQNGLWGVLMARIENNNGKKYKTFFWGNSLRTSPEKELFRLFQSVVDAVFQNKLPWVADSCNFMLDILKYEEQQYSFSCGPYIVSLMTEFASDCGEIPNETFSFEYSSGLSERYRFSAAVCAIEAIIDDTVKFGRPYINEVNVLMGLREARLTRSEARLVDKIDDTDEISIDNDSVADQDEEIRKSDEMGVAREEQDVEIEGKESDIDFDEPPIQTGRNMNGTGDVSRNQTSTTESEEREKDIKVLTDCTNDVLLKPLSDNFEAVEIANFVDFVSSLVYKEFQYTIHFCRPMKKKTKFYASMRVKRFLHKKKCRSAINAKLVNDGKRWIMTGSFAHNHEPTEQKSREEFERRYHQLLESIAAQLPEDVRKEFEAHYAKSPQHIPHLDSDQLILDSARMDATIIQSNGSHQRSIDGSLALTDIFGRQTPTFDEDELNELVGLWNPSHEAPYVITDTDDNKLQKISQLEAMQATLNAFSSTIP